MTKEEILTKIANEHSYETWDEFMYDSHGYTQIEYTCEAMEEYSNQQNSELQKKVYELENDFMAIQEEMNVANFNREDKKDNVT